MKLIPFILICCAGLLNAEPYTLSHPYTGPTTWTMVTVHNHSSVSDGDPDSGPNKNLSALTKHYLDTNDFGGFMITEHGRFSTNAVPAYNSKGVFLTGQEITQTKHLLAMFTSGLIQNDYPTANTDWQLFINNTIASNGVIGFAHPSATGYVWDTNVMIGLEGITFVEVYNAITMDLSNSWSQACAEDKWDELLSMGKRYWGYAAMDAHTYYMTTNAWNQVFLTTTNEASIKAAWTNGNFTFGRGSKMSVAVSGHTITMGCDSNSTISVITNRGGIAATSTGTNASYVPNGTERYVRFRAIQTANTNLAAWSQPIYVDVIRPSIGAGTLYLR